jgi:hypothetical protein
VTGLEGKVVAVDGVQLTRELDGKLEEEGSIITKVKMVFFKAFIL